MLPEVPRSRAARTRSCRAHPSYCPRRRGLLQGAILSPFLCNVHLDAFDRVLAARDIPFVRYADDFLLFAPDRETAQAAARCAGELLRRLGLRLHPRKTRVRHAREVRFLGEPLVRGRRARAPATA